MLLAIVQHRLRGVNRDDTEASVQTFHGLVVSAAALHHQKYVLPILLDSRWNFVEVNILQRFSKPISFHLMDFAGSARHAKSLVLTDLFVDLDGQDVVRLRQLHSEVLDDKVSLLDLALQI